MITKIGKNHIELGEIMDIWGPKELQIYHLPNKPI